MNRYITALDQSQQLMLSMFLASSHPGQYDINEGEMVFARDTSGVVTIWVYQQPAEA